MRAAPLLNSVQGVGWRCTRGPHLAFLFLKGISAMSSFSLVPYAWSSPRYSHASGIQHSQRRVGGLMKDALLIGQPQGGSNV